MELKLVCTKCGTVNESDAKYCKECGTGKASISEGITKLAELAKIKDTARCLSCGREKLSKDSKCIWCSQYNNFQPYTNPLGPSNPYETTIRYGDEVPTKNI